MADKPLTIGEVVERMESGDPQFAELRQNIDNADVSFAKQDRSFACRACGQSFAPGEGQWIFYNLCDGCFAEFDAQKMRGRFRGSPSLKPSADSDPGAAAVINDMIDRFGGGTQDDFYTESCDEWVAWRKTSFIQEGDKDEKAEGQAEKKADKAAN